jgi:FkbM family methyltransferase
MDRTVEARTKLRYRWSHRHPVHRAAVRAANRVLPLVPFPIKYAATDLVRRRNLPYRLLGPGSVAIQIGAPRDTLRSGRSRAMTFARLTRPDGCVVVVEPDPGSAEDFRLTAARRGLNHVRVVSAAAWSERASLELEVDAAHPATNFTSGTVDYGQTDLTRFHKVTVDAVPVDALVADFDLHSVDVISITTNGAEEQILAGMSETLARHRPYVCLARTRDSYSTLMSGLGYDLLGQDDRGFTFKPRGV